MKTTTDGDDNDKMLKNHIYLNSTKENFATIIIIYFVLWNFQTVFSYDSEIKRTLLFGVFP
jgi:hypothetical protein